MLSYLHAFHAGNHADVLKHSVLALVLDYMTRKDKPFVYVDTHAGAGLYDLHAERAALHREYAGGIARLWDSPASLPVALQPYLDCVRALNPDGMLRHYPGSPRLAQCLLRAQDRARLHELHPHESACLRALFAGMKRVQVLQDDGFDGLRADLPPSERRGVILIDPPYEVQDDYQRVVETLIEAYRRFATGVYLLWYPVLRRALVGCLERALVASGIRNILLAELCVAADAQQAGMTGSGMFVINPPWVLEPALQGILPVLQRALAGPDGGCRLQTLVAG